MQILIKSLKTLPNVSKLVFQCNYIHVYFCTYTGYTLTYLYATTNGIACDMSVLSLCRYASFYESTIHSLYHQLYLKNQVIYYYTCQYVLYNNCILWDLAIQAMLGINKNGWDGWISKVAGFQAMFQCKRWVHVCHCASAIVMSL